MASPLVETKLYVPQVRSGVLPRPRLSRLLARGSQARMTLVSAPAGFGKTTLLASWIGAAAGGRSVAWLSLDSRDREPGSFWTGVLAALQTVVPGLGASVLPLLQSAQPPIETVLASVLNELNGLPRRLDLVLDDYHLADGPDVGTGMTFLVEHLPPQVHVVISTRVDPALPLARMRVRGELVEIRVADLRFTRDEVASYLDEVVALDLTDADVETLEARTEGWIAALQLAALSLEGREDAGAFIAGFAGDDRYVVDYLVEEVLGRQPDDVREFLLQTSVLDRLSGRLCDAVTGQGGGKRMLERLDHANLFVVGLDDSRRWYRYHHLFADVLRTHLRDERPEQVAELHRRASDWYDRAGEPRAAVSHALEAGDVERAAALVELAIPAMLRDRQEATVRGWVDDIPDDVVRVRPVLAAGFVGALMSRNEFDGIEARLDEAERLVDATTSRQDRDELPTGIVVVDRTELARLPGALALYRAALALVRGDPSATVRHAELALSRAPEEDHLTRAGACAVSGLASWGSGDLEAAHAAYSAAVEGLQRAGHVADVLACSITLADIRITQGRLGDAQRTYERALELASRTSGTLRGTPDMHVGLSQIACERGDLAAAGAHLQSAIDLGESAGLPQNPYRRRVAQARLLEVEGDLAGARDLLDEAQQVYLGDFSPDVRPVSARRARVLVAQGDLAAAVAWADAQGLSADDAPSYLREYEHVTLARLLLAQHAVDRSQPALRDVGGLLDRLGAAAEEGGRTGSAIEILVLRARAHHAAGNLPAALTELERALVLAEPEGYVQVFVGEGQPIGTLMRSLAKQPGDTAYVRRLLDVGSRPVGPGAGRTLRPPGPGLVEPLSDRELDVLRLLAGELDGPDIARRLGVSLNTLRTHTRHIYAKLGVGNRRAAVRRAGQLDLLSRDRRR